MKPASTANLKSQKFILKERKMDISRFLINTQKTTDSRVSSANFQSASPAKPEEYSQPD